MPMDAFGIGTMVDRFKASLDDDDQTMALLTPERQSTVKALNRRVSNLAGQVIPRAPTAFLRVRLAFIESELEVCNSIVDGYKEGYEKGLIQKKADYEALIGEKRSEADGLEKEKIELLKRGKFMEEDLQDTFGDIQDAYHKLLHNISRKGSEEGQKQMKRRGVLPQDRFSKRVTEYLDAETQRPGHAGPKTVYRWCCVLGTWLPKELTKCAHIVPKSFGTSQLAYAFGTDDGALESERNGLVMHQVIQKGFDNGWLVIVPDGSLERISTRWEVIVLNPTILNKMMFKIEERIYRWTDFDGRPLEFRNINRPARRYLYFRYLMTYMHAEKEGYEGFKEKLPPGTIWASFHKSSGYLRSSVLRSLGRKVGNDDLPQDLVDAGSFQDTIPGSENAWNDILSPIDLAQRIREHIQKRSAREESRGDTYRENLEEGSSSEDEEGDDDAT